MARRDHRINSRADADALLAFLYTYAERHTQHPLSGEELAAVVHAASLSPTEAAQSLPPAWRARYVQVLAGMKSPEQLELFPHL